MKTPEQNTETNYEVEDGVILDGDTTIEVINDTPEADKNRTPLKEAPAEVTDDELAKYSDQKLKDRLAHLGKGYHEERRAKEAAARERDEAFRLAQTVVAENQKLQGSLANNQNALLEQAKKVVGSEIEEAKREYKAAQEAFDTDGIVEAQQKLSAAMIRADRVNNFRPATVQPQQNVVQTQPRVQQPQLDAKTREWNEQNSWFGSDRKMTAYALSLHEDLVESGVPVASDDYFNRINADMKGRFPEAFAGESAGAKSSQRARSSVVAPASRSTASKKVVLTQTQVNLAKRMGIPLEAYARSVAEIERKM